MRTTVAAIDFGTNKIVALVAETSGRQRCDIVGAGIAPYDGFAQGQWNVPAKVNDAIAKAVREAETQSHTHIREINVGVPGEFTRVLTVEAKVDLQGADPHVTMHDIEEVFTKATNDLGKTPGTVIHRSPAWFAVDDGKKTLEPMGLRGYELRAMVTFVVADQFFLDDVNERFRSLNVVVNGCFSTATGQAMLYVPDEERDHTAVLIDVGYLNTEVMAVQGDALIFHKVIPIGGGMIAADLAYGLEISLENAELIKRNYTFGLSTGQSKFDSTDKDGKPVSFDREKVKEILEARVDEIADQIKDAIAASGVKLGEWSNMYLTGGGLSFNRGGREYLSGKLGKPVKDLPRKAVKLSSPAYSSALGLLDLIIDTISNTRTPVGGAKSFFRSLFGG